MKTASFVFQKIRNCGLALQNKQVLSTYMRLLFTSLLYSHKTSESIFGYTIYFFHYSSFLSMFEAIFIHEEYHFESQKKNPFIIDCGTNIGLELIYYKRLYPQSKIMCFEPDKKTFQLLQKNIVVNNFMNVNAHNIAVSNTKGWANLYVNIKDPGSLIMSTKKERGLKNKIIVPQDRLSSYIKKKVDFLKLDIEGAEGAVLTDLYKRKKLKYIQQMIIEYHHHIQKNRDEFSSFLSMLEKSRFGYQIVTSLRTPFEKEKYQDILISAYKK